jgi:hypothetical protein
MADYAHEKSTIHDWLCSWEYSINDIVDNPWLNMPLPENLSSPPVFSGVCVTLSLDLYVCFVDRCLSFCTFVLAIVLSVLLRYTDSDYPFGIFKLFCHGKPGVNSGSLEGKAVPAPLVTPVVLIQLCYWEVDDPLLNMLMRSRLMILVCPFVLLFWPLCCLFFYDIRILITPLVSSNSSAMECPLRVID